MRQVYRTTFFEIGLLRTVLGGTGVSALRPNPSVKGWIMHSLSSTVSINRRVNASIEFKWIDVWDVPNYIQNVGSFSMT